MFLRPTDIIQELRSKKYVLPGMAGADFGCGGGYFTALLANEVGPEGKIYAIDIQEEVLKEAQEFLANFGIKNVKFLKQDLEVNCGLEDNSVDFVFISQVLYQSEEPEKIIAEAKRVLKSNGHLIILEPQTTNPLFYGQKTYSFEEVRQMTENQNLKFIEFKTIGEFYLLILQK